MLLWCGSDGVWMRWRCWLNRCCWYVVGVGDGGDVVGVGDDWSVYCDDDDGDGGCEPADWATVGV